MCRGKGDKRFFKRRGWDQKREPLLEKGEQIPYANCAMNGIFQKVGCKTIKKNTESRGVAPALIRYAHVSITHKNN